MITVHTMHHIDVHVEKDIYDVNNRLADANAAHLKDHGIRAFDLLGAIGSGKTATIERLVPLIQKRGGLRAVPSPGGTSTATTTSSGSSPSTSRPTTRTPGRSATSTPTSSSTPSITSRSMRLISSSSRTSATWSVRPTSGWAREEDRRHQLDGRRRRGEQAPDDV